MQEASIARNYAEALLTLARKADDAAGFGALISALGDTIGSDPTFRKFLDSPKVSSAQKRDVLGKALEGKAPVSFIRFVQKVVENRRQMLFGEVATAYHDLLDAAEGRVHARVTVAREYDAAQRDALAASLSKAIGKTVVPHVTVDPAILGGVVVRFGDTVMDGSVRRRLGVLRDKLLAAR